MENRGIEIAQKKARHRAGVGANKRHWKATERASGRSADKPIFFTAPDLSSPPARFPSDIVVSPRPINTTSLLVLALATPAMQPTPAAAPDAPALAAPRRRPRKKAAAKGDTPNVAAKPAKARTRGAGKAAKAAKPKAKTQSAAQPAPPVAKMAAKPRTRARKPATTARRTRRSTATPIDAPIIVNAVDTPILLLPPPPTLTAIAPPEPLAPLPATAMTDTAQDDHAVAPLPRAQTIALYRKGNVFDLIGYWWRKGWAGLSRSLGASQRPR